MGVIGFLFVIVGIAITLLSLELRKVWKALGKIEAKDGLPWVIPGSLEGRIYRLERRLFRIELFVGHRLR